MRMRRGKVPPQRRTDTALLPQLPLAARASQDDVATVASVTTVWSSELLLGLTVEAAHPVTSTAPADEHSAMVHKMSLQFFLGEQFLPGGFLVLGAVRRAG